MPRTKRTARARTAALMFPPALPTFAIRVPPPGTRRFIPALPSGNDASPLEQLLLQVFSSYQPRFSLGTSVPMEETESKKAPATGSPLCKEDYVSVLNHPAVFQFLPPQDVLELWRCCKSTWYNLPSAAWKKKAMLPNVFQYLRISEECAQFVDKNAEGSWDAFLPVLVKLCQGMAHIYYPLEPDPAHRAYCAEQHCFEQDYYDEESIDAGMLANYELYMQLRVQQEEEELRVVRRPTPSAELPLRLGKPTRYHDVLTREPEGPNYCEAINQVIGWNRKWMQEHASEMTTNNHYRRRIERGMYPLIVLGENWDTEYGVDEWSLGVGPHGEQFVVRQFTNIDSRVFLKNQMDTFYYCFVADDADGSDNDSNDRLVMKGGMMEYLLCYPCTANTIEFPTDDEIEPRVGLGIALWCLRHALEPLTTDRSIDWVDVIQRECQARADAQEQRRQGRVAYTEQDCAFLIEALTSPLYGPANLEKWMSKVPARNDNYPDQHHVAGY